MKPVLRYQSQLLFRKSYKPSRVIRIRPMKLNFEFRPVRFGLKPQLKTHECETHCAVDIQQDRRGEFFELRVPEPLSDWAVLNTETETDTKPNVAFID
jgi:hypothetical protein